MPGSQRSDRSAARDAPTRLQRYHELPANVVVSGSGVLSHCRCTRPQRTENMTTTPPESASAKEGPAA